MGQKYVAVILLGLLVLGASILLETSDSDVLDSIERPEIKQGKYSVPIKVTAEKHGIQVEEESVIVVKSRNIDDSERVKALENLMDKIPVLILGENENLECVFSDLNLITKDEETGILIDWESDNTDLVREDGAVNVTYLDGSEDIVHLRADLSLGSSTSEITIDVNVINDEEHYPIGLKRQIGDIIEILNDTDEGASVILPRSLDNGTKLKWQTAKESDLLAILFFMIIGVLMVYIGRYTKIEKEKEDFIRGIRNDFPGFLDKFVLLLNSGLVASTVMKKIADDSDSISRRGKPGYLYNEISIMQKKVDETNTSLIKEWKAFGKRSGISEILRFCNILEDNLNKGSSLASKLAIESESIRKNRKDIAEEKGKIADTKMTLPMMMLLGVLVLITIAPSLIKI